MPVRGPDGFLVKCEPNEVGEAVSQILNDPSKPAQRFEGYADEVATEKKIIRGAFEEGDACLLYTSPSPRDLSTSRMPSSA